MLNAETDDDPATAQVPMIPPHRYTQASESHPRSAKNAPDNTLVRRCQSARKRDLTSAEKGL